MVIARCQYCIQGPYSAARSGKDTSCALVVGVVVDVSVQCQDPERKEVANRTTGTSAFRLSGHHMLGWGCVLQYSGTNARMHETKLPLPETAVFVNSIVGLIDVPGFPHSLDYYSDGCAV
jgi:hypothetical protein